MNDAMSAEVSAMAVNAVVKQHLCLHAETRYQLRPRLKV